MATVTLESRKAATTTRPRTGRSVATTLPRTPRLAQRPSALVPGQVTRSAVRGGYGAAEQAVELTQRGLAAFVGTTSLVCGISLYTVIVQLLAG
ncbi:MAG: hypothetical protein ACRCWS_04235 [Propionibacteriaceae bacterium]